MKIEWSQAIASGNEAIDQDHHQLIDIINRLAAAIEQETSGQMVEQVLSEVANYIGDHFHHEEELMERFRYPERNEHIFQHWSLIQNLSAIILRYEKRDHAIERDTLEFLKMWFLDHTSSTDKKFNEFLSGKIRTRAS